MKRELPVYVVVGALVVVLVIAAALLLRSGTATSGSGRLTETDKASLVGKARDAMVRTRGDVAQMTPDERKAYDEALKRGLITNPFMAPKQVYGFPSGQGGASSSRQGYPPSNMTRPPQGYPPSNMSGPPQGYPPSNMRGPQGGGIQPPPGMPPSNLGGSASPR